MTVETGTEPTEQQLWDQEAAALDKPTEVAQEVTAEPTDTAKAAAPTNVEPTDPFEGLHPAIRAKLEAQDQLMDRIRKAEGHIGGLTSENKRIKDELAAAKAAAEAVKSAPTQAQVAKAQVSTEKWDQLKQDFPEWADALEEKLTAHTPAQQDFEGLRSQIREELTPELTKNISEKLRAEIAAETEGRLVNIAHRNWTETVKTPEFASWYESQDDGMKALGASSTAEDAITLLDAFKASTAGKPTAQQIKQQRQQRMQEAATVARGTQQSVAPVKSTDDMTAEEYWNHLARQGAAKK